MVKFENINTEKVLERLQNRSNSDIEYFEIISADEQEAEIMECNIGDALVLYHNNRNNNLYIELL